MNHAPHHRRAVPREVEAGQQPVGQPTGVRGRGVSSAGTGGRDFTLLWSAVTASHVGTRVGQISIPLLAVGALAATPLQMGLLTAAQTLGALLIGLPAGVVVDRVPRYRLMLGMNLVRAAALLSVAAAVAAGLLGLTQLFVVAVVSGIATVFFDLAQLAQLPALVRREWLVPANARLQASQSVAVVTGPGVGGALLALAGGAGTVLTASVSYLLSTVLLGRIRPPAAADPAQPAAGTAHQPATGGLGRQAVAEVGEGLRFVLADRRLRAIACCTGSCNLFMAVVLSQMVLFLVRTVHLSSTQVGLVLGLGGAGGVSAALTARRWARRFGPSRATGLALLVAQPFALLLPTAESGWRAIPAAVGWFVVGYGNTVYNIMQVSLRQAVCPARLLGRVNAANRMVALGTVPIGGLLGGLLGTGLGSRGALWLGSAGLIVSVAWLRYSPLWYSDDQD